MDLGTRMHKAVMNINQPNYINQWINNHWVKKFPPIQTTSTWVMMFLFRSLFRILSFPVNHIKLTCVMLDSKQNQICSFHLNPLQYSNVYVSMPKLKELLTDAGLKRECLDYVALPGMLM